MRHIFVKTVGLLGLAAFSAWVVGRSRHAASRNVRTWQTWEVDDDTAADIIARFRPALEECAPAYRP